MTREVNPLSKKVIRKEITELQFNNILCARINKYKIENGKAPDAKVVRIISPWEGNTLGYGIRSNGKKMENCREMEY